MPGWRGSKCKIPLWGNDVGENVLHTKLSHFDCFEMTLGRLLQLQYKIRGGTIGLRIETGRWRGQPREERICQSCSSVEIEDVEHWLIRCSAMNHWRQPVFNLLQMHVNNFNEFTDENKLRVLLHMACKNPIMNHKDDYECL